MITVQCRRNRKIEVTITEVFYEGTKYPLKQFRLTSILGDGEAIATGPNTFDLIPNSEQVENQGFILEAEVDTPNGVQCAVDVIILQPRGGDESVIYCRMSGPKALDR